MFTLQLLKYLKKAEVVAFTTICRFLYCRSSSYADEHHSFIKRKESNRMGFNRLERVYAF